MKFPSNEQVRVKVLELADRVAKDAEREASELPRPQVYSCRSLNQIKKLLKYQQEARKDYEKHLPGSTLAQKEVLLGLIKAMDYEIEQTEVFARELDVKGSEVGAS